jgi:hypothetical protein
MGGHALNKVIASRINLEQYNKVKKDLEEKFGNYLELEFIIDVPGKIDFGDVDILYMVKKNIKSENLVTNNSFTNNFDIVQLINQIYNSVEIVLNGPVCSFAYKLVNDNEQIETNKYFQVDLIYVEDLPMSRFYFSYGDLGGIIGRLTQHKSLTYGSKGLWVNPNQETISKFLSRNQISLQVDSEVIKKSFIPNIILTNKPEKICEYLGLEWDKWLNGFNSKLEIFEWIKKSSWFKKDYFRALDYEHRHRVNYRPMYQEFLKYIFTDEPNFSIEKGNSLNYINQNLQIEALEYFNKINILTEEIIQIEKRLIRKEKFSGKKFLELGIESRQIKKYLDNFKLYVETEYKIDFENWLDSNESMEIDRVINVFGDKKNK